MREPAVPDLERTEAPLERGAYSAPDGVRRNALALTALVYAVLIAALALKISDPAPVRPAAPSVPLIVTLLPLASSPEPPRPAPERTPEAVSSPKPVKIAPAATPVPPAPAPATTAPARPAEMARPEPATPQPTAVVPKAEPSTPTQEAQSHAPDSWEGRVLARIERFRRYPGAARHARQQGVAYIRFRIDRDGHVLASSLVRSSGFPTLDQAALDTLRRADPLPKIPADRPDTIEIVVPVEFFLN